MTIVDRREAQPKGYTPHEVGAHRGPRKQVFVCGVTKRSEPVRQDSFAVYTIQNLP